MFGKDRTKRRIRRLDSEIFGFEADIYEVWRRKDLTSKQKKQIVASLRNRISEKEREADNLRASLLDKK